MKLIVGLGNPGKKYNNTRHNVGFNVIDLFASSSNITLKKDTKFQSEIGIDTINGEKVILVKPLTFMNLSGNAVISIVNYYKIDSDDIIIIYDDLDLPIGKIRLKQKGGHGGHNGVRSIIDNLNTKDFKRLKIGIDKTIKEKTKNYVLEPFSKAEQPLIKDTFAATLNILDDFLRMSFIDVMNKYN